ncbi:substrate-binding domain-containing protein [Sporomusa acidovorans]|uniref:PBP superfamily domain protein n=1 Tax=Sporomusa acidovorans (strain ATCC 49682 / DSM 3132 / Mol) TaxID=1123286 RepID=A0ABZ3J8V9_SPOA4|nr:helix-turn-helix transcriptional regulator [Sporomusa acidovorans]OZC17547.1 PBP superfamily domain protein [Sporomusa acidovorans DSM 3132]SDF09244.1 putative molybdopterin biosynthesis protein [Sporomusa acidovorans]
MSDTTSYTPEEVAKILKISRFTVYEMIKRGDLAAYHIGRKVRVEAPDLENYIQKSKKNTLAPSTAAQPSEQAAIEPDSLILCGQDIILDILIRNIEKAMPQIRCFRNYSGSIDGLLALYRGTVNATAVHLWDSDTDTYNIPYVRRFLPGHRTMVYNLASRNTGFYVAKSNPKAISTWKDLTRPDVKLINRERGSGARVLLDEMLHVLDIDCRQVRGYAQEETSHLAIASYVARGEADVGIGIEKAALQVDGVDFILQKKERYDIVFRKEDADKPPFKTLLSIIRSETFRNEVAGMGGYDLSHTGELMASI